MGIEQHLTTEWFWAAATALLALAGLVGGLTSWLVATLIKRRERPEPEWISWMFGRAYLNDSYGSPDGIKLEGTIANAGEGSAFNVRIEGISCDAGFPVKAETVRDRLGVMRPGESTAFWCSITLDKWEAAQLKLTWIEPPTRLKKEQSLVIVPSAEIPRPGMKHFNEQTGQYETQQMP